ncbi:MAG: AAA family ATPase, partial [Verrucomicrobia bacterium]|nr:AAA family ATPase [Verrucomicrobiota bacterium]
LRRNQFADAQHGLIFERLVESPGADPNALAAKLKQAGELEAVGGKGALAALLCNGGGAEHVAFFAEAIEAAWKRRENAKTIRHIEAEIGKGRDLGEVLAEVAPAQTASEKAFLDSLNDGAITTGQLSAMDVPPKEKLLGDFFEVADFGFIYATRGLGKTWESMAMADAMARGIGLGEWSAGDAPRRVLMVDGEMSLSDSKARAEALNMADGLQWIHNEHLFNVTGKTLNLTDPAQQDALFSYCKAQRIDCVFIDNLSCLFYGIRENDADDWGECVLPWILRMRREGIAVILVAHAGRNGLMRGTSKREDQAHWVLKLKQAPSSAGDDDGATFISHFTKNRHSPEKSSPSLLWNFLPQADGKVEIVCKVHTGYDAFLDMVKDGVDSNGDIADAMGVNKATVSKWIKRGVDDNKIEKDRRALKWIG